MRLKEAKVTIRHYPDRVLAMLQESDFDFYLTGSRYFGNPRGESDYDFFVQHSEAVAEYLENLGFRADNKAFAYYDGDPSLIKLYFQEIRMCGPHYHIQLVKDAQAKNHIQEILKATCVLPLLSKNKDEERRIWQAAWKLLGPWERS